MATGLRREGAMGTATTVRILRGTLLRLLGATAGVLMAVGLALGTTARLPHYDHVLVVILENHSFNQIFERADAPFLRALRKKGAIFTRSFGVTHPSQPNYFALFSGSSQGVRAGD